MKANIKQILPQFLIDLRQKYNEKREVTEWEKAGKPLPPPHLIKQQAINFYQREHNISTFVETGTYRGDMVWAMLKTFEEIISVELGEQLWKDACKRFSKYSNVKLLQGDSGVILKDVVPQLKNNVIFWLDGHYSAGNTAKGEKDCPIYEELDSILKSNLNHILLIDDARLFVGAGDYPTLHELQDYISPRKFDFQVKEDIIRILLK